MLKSISFMSMFHRGTIVPKKEMSEKRKQLIELIAIRRATAVASGSVSHMMWDDHNSDMSVLSRQASELKSDLVETEIKIRGLITFDMDDAEKAETIFDLLDYEKSGKLDLTEIAEGLRKIDDMPLIRELMSSAQTTIDEYVEQSPTIASKKFQQFLRDFAQTMLSSYDEVCHLLVLKVIFADFGRERLQAFVADLIEQECTVANMDRFIAECRLRYLFDIMKLKDQYERVDFKDVVKHLFHFSHDMSEAQRDILFAMKKDNQRTLRFAEFFEFVLSFLASLSSDKNFHEVANHMTSSARKQEVTDEDIKVVFLKYNESNAHYHLHTKLDAVSSRKLDRLFDLWDLDKSGTLDFEEFEIGMKKFQEARGSAATSMEDIKKFMASVDDNDDGTLDKGEFASLVAKFAALSNIELHTFIDFMVVQTSLKNNNDLEKAYIANMRKLAKHQDDDPTCHSDGEDEEEEEEERKEENKEEEKEEEKKESEDTPAAGGNSILKNKLKKYMEVNNISSSENKKNNNDNTKSTAIFAKAVTSFAETGGIVKGEEKKEECTKEQEEEIPRYPSGPMRSNMHQETLSEKAAVYAEGLLTSVGSYFSR